MRTRPIHLTALAIFLTVIAVFMPLQIMIQFGHTPMEWQAVLGKLSPLNWLFILSAASLAVSVLRASLWTWFFGPLFLAVTAWNNYMVGELALNYSSFQATVATAFVFAVAAGTLSQKQSRKVLINPGLRWWLTPPRKKARLRAVLWPTAGGEITSYTYDMSEGGAFVAIGTEKRAALSSGIRNLKVGTHCLLRIHIGDERVLHCHAEVVREMSERRGAYPSGIGVRFVQLSRSQRQAIAEFLEKVDDGYDYSVTYGNGPQKEKSA